MSTAVEKPDPQETPADEFGVFRKKRSTRGLILALAAPVLIEQILAMLVGWSDAFLVGKHLVAKPFLSAIVVGNYLLWFLECWGTLISAGSHAVIARMVGSGQYAEANRLTHQSLRLAFGLGCAQSLLTFQFAPVVIGWMNLDGFAHELAVRYLRILAVSAPMMQVLLVGVICLQAAGNTGIAMGLMVAANGVNIAFSWTLCVGIGPVAPRGWNGVAAGTTVGFMVGGLAALLALYRGVGVLRLSPKAPPLRRDDVRRLLRIGIPGAANTLGIVLCQLWFLSIIGRLGDASVGAHGVATRCESLSYLAAEAFAVAGATLVGQALGARKPELARKAGWEAFRCGAWFLAALGVVFFVFAPQMIRLFVDATQHEVLRLGVPILRLVSLAMPALAASIIFTGSLRGAGDTRWPLVYSMFGFLAVRIPLAYWLTGPLGMGVFGAWIAMFVDLYVRGVCAALRYRYGNWTQIKV